MPANPQTQDGLKSKGGRLLGFSRANSDAGVAYNVPAPKQAAVPARSDTPNAAPQPEHALPTREEIAKASKIQAPTKPRKQTPGPQTIWDFPSQDSRKSPAKPTSKPKPQLQPAPQAQHQQEPERFSNDEDATNRALFDGSQLGDDFMNSRVTTPRNEPEDAFLHHLEGPKTHQRPFQEEETVRPFQQQRKERSPELGHEIVHHEKAQRRSSAQLQVAENGRFLLHHPTRTQRRERSNVRDGFSNEPLQEKHRQRDDRYGPAEPAKSTRDLPYRPVKIKSQKKEHRHGRQRPQETSPYDNFARQPANAHFEDAGEVIELEDDEVPLEEPTQEATPKPRRIRKQPQQALMESAMPPPSKSSFHPQLKKRTRASLDYDDKALSQKTFGDLLNEPFDLDPAQAGNDQGGDGNPLSNKLDRFANQPEEEQREFFASMTMEDWEESGDWLVDRFTDLMKRMKEARREKRKIAVDFEMEAAKRAEAVEKRSDALDRKMCKMRQDGLRVVGEKQA